MATFPRGHNARNLRRPKHTTTTTDTPTTTIKITWTVDPTDARTLRGIPAIGRGVAGHIPGTSPQRIVTLDVHPMTQAQSSP